MAPTANDSGDDEVRSPLDHLDGPGPDRAAADPDPFDLRRFVAAQDEASTFERALAEVGAGSKRSHWMWFIYPQIAGLGGSPMARRYAVSGPDEARAYLRHPVLGPRLLAAARAAATTPGSSADAVFGAVDALKLRSSMTLFALVAEDTAAGAPTRQTSADPQDQWVATTARACRDVLERFYAGEPDPATVRLLAAADRDRF